MIVRIEVTYKSGKTLKFNNVSSRKQSIDELINSMLRKNHLVRSAQHLAKIYIKVYDIELNEKLVATIFAERSITTNDRIDNFTPTNKFIEEQDLTKNV